MAFILEDAALARKRFGRFRLISRSPGCPIRMLSC